MKAKYADDCEECGYFFDADNPCECEPIVDPQIGDILYTSTGYQETSVTFYKVTKVSKTQITFGAISKKVEKLDYLDGKEIFVWYVPNLDSTPKKDTYRRKFSELDDSYYATISPSQGTAFYWEGEPKRATGRDNRR